MRAQKLYEDVLDDIDEIKPDVPEEEPEKFEVKPGFDHNIVYPIAEHWSSQRIALAGDMCRERLRTYATEFNAFTVDFRKDEELARSLGEKFGYMELQHFAVIQFNAPDRWIYRLLLFIFEIFPFTPAEFSPVPIPPHGIYPFVAFGKGAHYVQQIFTGVLPNSWETDAIKLAAVAMAGNNDLPDRMKELEKAGAELKRLIRAFRKHSQ